MTNKKIVNFLIKVLIATMLGLFFVALSYYLGTLNIKYPHNTEYYLYQEIKSYLYIFGFIGFLLSLFFITNSAFRYLAISTLIIYIAYLYYDKPIYKKIYFKNFSNSDKTLFLNKKEYKVHPNRDIYLYFTNKPTDINGTVIKSKGSFFVNMSYPEKFIIYSRFQGFFIGNMQYYDAFTYKQSRKLITKIDSNTTINIQYSISKPIESVPTYYLKAVDTFNKKYQEEAKLYKNACNNKMWLKDFCSSLAGCYIEGRGVKQDYQKAKELYKKLCDVNYSNACYNLGVLYSDGEIKQDFNKSAQFYKKACDLENSNGCFNLAHLYSYGVLGDKNYTKATKLYAIGCNKNDADSCYVLSLHYKYGLGVDKNETIAKGFLRKACKLGNKKACSKYEYFDESKLSSFL